MKTYLHHIFFLMTATLFFSCSQNSGSNTGTANTGSAEVREKIAADIADNLAKKDYAAVRKEFAKIMLDGLSEEKLKSTWEEITKQFGEYEKVVSTKEEKVQGYNQVKKRLKFAHENASLLVTYNEEDKVIGMFIKP